MMWQAYYRMEPFGELREDLRSGQITAAIYNVNRTKKSQKVWHAEDFVLKFKPVSGRSTDESKTWQKASPAVFADFKAYMIATSR